MNPDRHCRVNSGFTLVEIVLVVAAIGVLASTGYYTANNIQTRSHDAKLESDVASLNRSVQLYEANGGTIAPNSAANDVLIKLKTRSNATLGIGLTQNFVDPRTTAVFQSTSEAGSGQMRAFWDPVQQQFNIAYAGTGGIKEFDLNDSMGASAPALEARSQAMQPTGTLTTPSWIWQGNNTVAPDVMAGGQPPVVSEAASGTTPARNQLTEPLFSINTGAYILTTFNLNVTLSNPNNPAVSTIYYSLDNAALQPYTGSAISVAPGDVLSAYARSLDIQDWLDSDTSTQTYTSVPYQLQVTLSVPSSLTYQAAGGAMLSGTTASSTGTASTASLSSIPSKYQGNQYFVVMYDYGTFNPLSDPSAQAGTFSTASIDLSIGRWGTASSLVVSAASKAVNTQDFISSTVTSGTVGITPTVLASPAFNPSASYIDPDAQLSITPGSGYPKNYQIYYTSNGSDPGVAGNGGPSNSNAVLYSSAFTPSFGANGSLTYTARAYGPSAYAQWFTPSPAVSITTYSNISGASIAGALVGNASVNGTFIGSLIYSNADGNLAGSSINFNSGAVIDGNIFFQGTPKFTYNATASSVITGDELTNSGSIVPVTSDTNLVESLGGSASPTYNVTFNSNSHIEGKVFTQVTPPAMPTVSAPPSPTNSNSTSVNGTSTINPATTSGVTVNSGGTATLQPGAYSSVTANATIILGTPGVTTTYSFTSLTLNNGARFVMNGTVIITMAGGLTVNNGTVLGNSATPSNLQLYVSSGDVTVNSGGTIYGQLVAPNSNVTLNGNFNGGIVAKNLTINSNGVAFTLAPL